MAGSVNKVILVGNLGQDPEIRWTQNGKAIANFSLATSETWRDRNTGEKREKTEWHRCACFNEGLNKVIEQYVKKGSKVYIEGQLQTRKWTDNQGVDRYTTEVVLQNFTGVLTMLDSRREDNADPSGGDYAAASNGGGYNASQSHQRPLGGAAQHNDMSDDIPFAIEWRG